MYYWFHQSFYMAKAFPFIGGWLADRLLGDPEGWPHPVVGFGKVISLGEKTLNKGNDRAVKGGVMALILVAGTYLLCERILALAGYFHPIVASILSGIGVFYCLAGKTLVKEVKAVFEAVDRSTPKRSRNAGAGTASRKNWIMTQYSYAVPISRQGSASRSISARSTTTAYRRCFM